MPHLIDALKPYPAYKNSGLPWLGKVPAHWEVRRNGRLFAQRNETGFGSLPMLAYQKNAAKRPICRKENCGKEDEAKEGRTAIEVTSDL